MMRFAVVALLSLWAVGSANAQCPGSASPCESFSDFTKALSPASPPQPGDRIPYVQDVTKFIPGQTTLPSVASTTALRATPTTVSPAILRLDFDVGFGAPPMLFFASSNPCSASLAGVDDNISCVAASNGGSWLGWLDMNGVSVMDAGVGPNQTAAVNSTNWAYAAAAAYRSGIYTLNTCINATPGTIVQINSVPIYGSAKGCQGATFKMMQDGVAGFALKESPTAETAIIANREVTWSDIRCDQNQKQGTCFLVEGYASGVKSMKAWNFKGVHLAATNAPDCIGAVGKGSISGTTLTITADDERPYNLFAPGQVLSDTLQSVVPGTTITGYGTGSGRTGTYTISTSQTVSATNNNIVAGCWTHDDGLYAAGTYPSANMIIKGISNGLAGPYYVEIDQPSFLQPGFDPDAGPAAIVPGQGILLTTTAGMFNTRPNVVHINGGNIQGYTSGISVQYGSDGTITKTDVSENSVGVLVGGYNVSTSTQFLGVSRWHIDDLYCESTKAAPEDIGVFFGTDSKFSTASFASCNAAAPMVDNSTTTGKNLLISSKKTSSPFIDQVIESAGTYSFPVSSLISPGLEAGWFDVTLVGAGGAGGGATPSDGTHNSIGTGGAGGGYVKARCYDPTQMHLIGAALTIGAGGDSVFAADGNPGTSTTLTDALSLTNFWSPSTAFHARTTQLATSYVKPVTNNTRGWLFGATTAGTSGTVEPNWDSVTLGAKIVDGTVTWQALGPTDWSPGMSTFYDPTTWLGTLIQPTVNNPLNYVFRATSNNMTGSVNPHFNVYPVLNGVLDGQTLVWHNIGGIFQLRAGGGKGGRTLTSSGNPVIGVAPELATGNLPANPSGAALTCQTIKTGTGSVGSSAYLYPSGGAWYGFSGTGGQASATVGSGAQGVTINGISTQIGTGLFPVGPGAGGAGAVSANDASGTGQPGGPGSDGVAIVHFVAGGMTGRQ